MNNEDKIKDNRCKARVETFNRVVGFMRPVQQFNKGKQAEFHDRKMFNLKKAKNNEIAWKTFHD